MPAKGSVLKEDGKVEFPPASPRLRQLLAQVDPHPTRKVAGPTVVVAPGKEQALDPEQAEQNKERAYAMLGQGGDPRAAHKLLAQAVEVVPDATALTVLAELELHNPLWRPRALDRLKLATTLAPQHTGAWLALANYWSLRAQPDKQRRCLEKVLAYDPKNQEARQTLELLEPDARS
jgi:tetratricopeptide (TPR) repeat protein